MTKPASHAKRRLGKTGPHIAPLAWGMWRFRGQSLRLARSVIEAALAIGVSLFDTADVYGPDNGEPFGAAETLLGRVLSETPDLRKQMVLASKAGIEPGVPYNSSTAYLIAACEASLRRLHTDHLDLFQIHRPDLLAHPTEAAEAFAKLRAAGKILEAGVSNYTASQTRALVAHMPFALASTQPEFSALAIDPITDGILDHAMEAGLTVLAWSPLAQGRLGVARPTDGRASDVAIALDRVARQHDASRTAVAYAWIMSHPSGAIPIVGSQQPSRISEAAQALDIMLSRQEWYAILTAARGAALP